MMPRMGIKSAWSELWQPAKQVPPISETKDDGSPGVASQFTVPTGTGYTSYAPRTVANVTQIGYMNNVIVYRAVTVLAQAISSLPWQVKNRYGKHEVIEKHPLGQLMERPNLKRSRSSFVEQMVSFLLIGGQNFLYPVVKGNDLKPLGLYNLRPDLMMPFYVASGEFGGWRYNIQHPVVYTPDQVHVNRFFHPFDELNGLSPLQVASAIIERQNAGEEWNFNLMSNMARPSGAFVSTVDLPPLTRGKLVQEIRKKYGRGRSTAGMPLLLENGLSYIQLALSPVDADWFQSDGAAGRKIAAAIGVDSVLLNDKEHSTYNNVLEAKVAMWELAGLPLLGRIEDDLNMWMPMGYGDDVYLEADRSPIELLKKNRSLDTAIVVNVWNAGLASFNACAQDLVQEPLPDKDDFFKFGPTLYVRKSEVSNWLDQQEERRNAPPMLGAPINNTLLPFPPKKPPAAVVTEAASKINPYAVKGMPDAVATMRQNHIAPFRLQVEDYFHQQYVTLLTTCNDKQRPVSAIMVDVLQAMQQQYTPFSDMLTTQYIRAAEEACMYIGQLFGVHTSIYQKSVASAIGTFVSRTTQQVQDATHNALYLLSTQKTADDFARALQELYQQYADNRAALIAEDETLTALNLGSMLGAKQIGLPMNKTWHTVGDSKVREWHREAEGQTVALTDQYNVGGDMMDFPKDDSYGAGPDNIANCRCYETYDVDMSYQDG